MPKILIVDDELDVREFAANFFRKRNLEVVTACDGYEALRIIEKDRPDLVLLDIRMPNLDGIETLGRIREKDKELKVIMVTGKNPEEDKSLAKCKELGVLAYIHKPLKLDELEKTVIETLKSIR
ncbi:MAG: response regulator [Candidatus Omnitrophica bacterium]|nr:response regulator [Candidatus Omnitrophota bacterium]